MQQTVILAEPYYCDTNLHVEISSEKNIFLNDFRQKNFTCVYSKNQVQNNNMNLRKLFGHDDKFFDLLESSAVEAQGSVQLLVNTMKEPDKTPTLDEFVQTRRKDKRITEAITEELCKTFVTPLEREDIEALSIALYKIPKTVEKFSEKFILCRSHIKDVDFSPQLRLLEQTTDTVTEMVKKLRTRAHLETMKDQNTRLHYLEGEADKLMLELVKELYSGKHQPLKVIIILDLYETLEKIIDRCRDAGNVIFQIVLKYS
ncbi:MAG: DUF47 family protein [Kiritimatiellae bacterium]|nr:DUF47 family protein [Kiritimatiellia bacterium]MDD5521643.1 DUF47 family protein [Kiritimatiellia bacterium]